MRDEGNLELVYVGASGLDIDGATGRASVKLDWLESEPGRTHPVPTPTALSPDPGTSWTASQCTLRAFYCDTRPVITGIVGAAVLERNDRGEPKVMPGMLAFKHVWVIPTVSDLPGLNQLVQVISSRGGTIVDPLDELPPKPSRPSCTSSVG